MQHLRAKKQGSHEAAAADPWAKQKAKGCFCNCIGVSHVHWNLLRSGAGILPDQTLLKNFKINYLGGGKFI
jgi:hypothetical protein